MKTGLLFLAWCAAVACGIFATAVFALPRWQAKPAEIGRFQIEVYRSDSSASVGTWRAENQIVKIDTVTGTAWRMEDHRIKTPDGTWAPLGVEWVPVFKDEEEARREYPSN